MAALQPVLQASIESREPALVRPCHSAAGRRLASVDTLKIGAQAVSADWNSYTAGWITFSGATGGSVQLLTISDTTVDGCVAWITFSAQIGLQSSVAGLAQGAIRLSIGTDEIGRWDTVAHIPSLNGG